MSMPTARTIAGSQKSSTGIETPLSSLHISEQSPEDHAEDTPEADVDEEEDEWDTDDEDYLESYESAIVSYQEILQHKRMESRSPRRGSLAGFWVDPEKEKIMGEEMRRRVMCYREQVEALEKERRRRRESETGVGQGAERGGK